MVTLKRQRLVKVLLIGLLAGSILAANAPAASALTTWSCSDNGGGIFRCCGLDKQGDWICNYVA